MTTDIKMINIPAGGGCEAFQMSETPITVAQWNAVMTDDQREGAPNHPVTRVSVKDCLTFCDRVGDYYRLPTEFEWCWACGREPENLADYAVCDQETICAVKTKLPNEYGLYDMRGLVWEWTGKKGRLRGGSWFNDPDGARAVYRGYDVPCFRGFSVGFRVVVVGRPPSR